MLRSFARDRFLNHIGNAIWQQSYYFSQAGNDSNDGLSIFSPKKTIAACSALTTHPEYPRLFRCGDSWREFLTVPVSGLTFDSYGVGNKPKILGSLDLSATGDWAAGGSSGSSTTNSGANTDNEFFYHDHSIGGHDDIVVGYNNGGSIYAGIRFLNIAIPQGATITSAYITFRSNETDSTTVVNVTIKGEKITASATFDYSWADYSGRTRTSASVAWSGIAAWAQNAYYNSADISAIITEIVGQSGWVSGNNLTLFIEDNGSSSNAYRDAMAWDWGSGNRPVLTINYTTGSNVWVTTATHTLDIGNLIFNNEASYSVRKNALGDLAAQGDYYYASSDHLIHLYSVSNPGTFYSHIEAAQYGSGIEIYDHDHITIRSIDLRYQGLMGISMINNTPGALNNILIEYCNFAWIGGSHAPTDVRAGNGVQVWNGCDYVTVRYNRFTQIYDTAMSPQGLAGSGYSYKHMYWYYNIVTNCENGFYFFAGDASHTVDELSNIYVCNNIYYDNGNVWSHNQRSIGDNNFGSGTVFTHIYATIRSNINFKNNITYLSTQFHIFSYGTYYNNSLAGFDIDYNSYYLDGAAMFQWQGGDHHTFAEWKSITGFDAHSIITDPKFVTPGTDFHLQTGSGCINAGVSVGFTPDYDGVTVGSPPEIGAYEK